MKKRSVLGLLTVVVVFAICITAAVNNLNNYEEKEQSAVSQNNGSLIVHYLDVGQGDSEFVELPNGKCMLIDASTDEYSTTIIDAVESFGYSKIDYVVATHPHEDHIGALDNVIDYFDVGEVYMPDATSSSQCFDDLETAIEQKQLDVVTAKTDTTVYDDGDLTIEFLSPIESSYSESNNYSAVLKITYDENSFLFMGDAESLVERELVEKYGSELDADVLKVGHHGGNNASCQEFLEEVTPEYAVISCGENNSYGHPHKETLDRLEDCQAQTYCTDDCSTITITCDGQDNFTVDYKEG